MSVVELKTASGDSEAAAHIRKLADQVERGTVQDCVIVYNNMDEKCFESIGTFQDRWRILGALEYAKQKVHEVP